MTLGISGFGANTCDKTGGHPLTVKKMPPRGSLNTQKRDISRIFPPLGAGTDHCGWHLASRKSPGTAEKGEGTKAGPLLRISEPRLKKEVIRRLQQSCRHT
jgi:hypothetical protein